MSEHGEKGEEEEEGVMSPKPPPFARAPSFEVVIDPMDEPWEWPAKQEKNTEDNSDDSDDDFFGRGSAASNEEVVCLCILISFLGYILKVISFIGVAWRYDTTFSEKNNTW